MSTGPLVEPLPTASVTMADRSGFELLGSEDLSEADWICAACGATTSARTCATCGGDSLLCSRYRLLAIVGRGSMGLTYRGVDIAEQREVAVRRVPLGAAPAEVVTAEILPLMRVREGVTHPALPRIYEHFIDGARGNRSLFVVRELVRGRSLETPERGHGVDMVLRTMEELLGLLPGLRRMLGGQVFVDLRPADVLRREGDGSLVLLEAGASRSRLSHLVFPGERSDRLRERLDAEGDGEPQELVRLAVFALELLTREPLRDELGNLDWEQKVVLPRSVHRLIKDLLEGRITRARDAVDRVGQARRALGASWSSDVAELPMGGFSTLHDLSAEPLPEPAYGRRRPPAETGPAPETLGKLAWVVIGITALSLFATLLLVIAAKALG